MMFSLLDRYLNKLPLAGWRTIILGYMSTTVPALIMLMEEPPSSGSELIFSVAKVLAGGAIHYFRAKA